MKNGWTTHSSNNEIWLAVSPCHMTMTCKINKLEKPGGQLWLLSYLVWQICCLLWSFSSGQCDVRVVHPHIIITPLPDLWRAIHRQKYSNISTRHPKKTLHVFKSLFFDVMWSRYYKILTYQNFKSIDAKLKKLCWD